jgi:hypothetical protein
MFDALLPMSSFPPYSQGKAKRMGQSGLPGLISARPGSANQAKLSLGQG